MTTMRSSSGKIVRGIARTKRKKQALHPYFPPWLWRKDQKWVNGDDFLEN